MRRGRNLTFVGSYITSEHVSRSNFTVIQQYNIDRIVEKLNRRLYETKTLHLVKHLYTRHDVLIMLEKVKKSNNCSYDDAIILLNKQLKEKNFDIYKS